MTAQIHGNPYRVGDEVVVEGSSTYPWLNGSIGCVAKVKTNTVGIDFSEGYLSGSVSDHYNDFHDLNGTLAERTGWYVPYNEVLLCGSEGETGVPTSEDVEIFLSDLSELI